MKAPAFKVLTFNTWLLRLPFGVSLASDVEERAALIPEAVRATGADIAVVQEVWEPKMRQRLRGEFARQGFGFEANASVHHPLFGDLPGPNSYGLAGSAWLLPLSTIPFHPTSSAWLASSLLTGTALASMAASSLVVQSLRKTLGNGLQVFSRFELSPQVDAMAFTSWTRPDEAFTSKGAMRVGAKVPGLGWIDVYNSHLGAVTYDSRRNEFDPNQTGHRAEHARQLCQWMEATRTSEFGFLGVDLNAAPTEPRAGETRPSEEYRLLTETQAFQDTYAAARPGDDGHTDVSENPYKRTGHFSNSPDCRIDYVFARRSGRVRTTESRVVLDQELTGTQAHRLSDHYGVLTEFSVEG